MFVAPQALRGGRKMRDEFVKHSDLVAFADASVNLKRDDAKEYREQVNRLRDKMEAFINENPDVGLRKMLLSGSLANCKGDFAKVA